MRRTVQTIAACIVLLLGWLASPASAQNVNLLFGITRSTLSTDAVTDGLSADTPALSRKGGAFFGVSVGTDAARRASIAVEGAYVVRGIRFDVPDAFSIVRLKYLAFPVVGRVRVATIQSVGVHLVAGPTVALRLGASEDVIRQSVSDVVGRYDAGVTFGVGVDVQGWTVQTRYEWGLIDIAKNGGLLGGATMKNRTLAILAVLPTG
jgi:hypothetical protein